MRCEKCNKLMRVEPERSICKACERKAVATESLSASQPEPPCPRCGLQPRRSSSEFCGECHAELIRVLGAAALELAADLAEGIEELDPHAGTHETFLAKRRRLPTHHVNVVGGRPLRGAVLV